MQTQQQAKNGAEDSSVKANGVTNGVHTEDEPAISPVTNVAQRKGSDKDIIRIIGQHLLDMGLGRSAEILMEESGCRMDHPVATRFRKHVLDGDWAKAAADIQELKPFLEDPESIMEMQFLILEQKYLECLEDGLVMDALSTLRYELTPLSHKTYRVHQLSAYIMCCTPEEVREQANWNGKESRVQLMGKLQQFLPPSVMLPPKRLDTLLRQAVDSQAEKCIHHNRNDISLETVSLVVDHVCSSDNFPATTVQILHEHSDEVLICRFSPDGKMLASGGKDNCVILWDVHPTENKLIHRKTLDGHQYHFGYVAWSPDSKYLVACGTDDTPEVWVWNAATGELHVKISPGPEDSLTYAAWHPDSRKFVVGGQRGQFYLCDLEGNVLDSWEGVRVNSLAYRKDGTVLAADAHHRIRSYVFGTQNTDCNVLKEDCPIMSFRIDVEDKLVLINVKYQGLHLWSLEDKCLIRKYQGPQQDNFVIHSCFGGVGQNFIASGSEEGKVYIWHWKREKPIAVLQGHSRTVNSVDWNPTRPDMMVSSSDDHTMRVWGPNPDPNPRAKSSSSSSSNGVSK